MMDKRIKKMLVDALVEVVDRAPLKKQMEFVGPSHNLRNRKTIENRGVTMQRRDGIIGAVPRRTGSFGAVPRRTGSFGAVPTEKIRPAINGFTLKEKGILKTNYVNQIRGQCYQFPGIGVQRKAEFEAWMGYVNKTLNTTSRYVNKAVFDSTQKKIQEIAVNPEQNYAAKTNDVCKAILDYAQDIIYL